MGWGYGTAKIIYGVPVKRNEIWNMISDEDNYEEDDKFKFFELSSGCMYINKGCGWLPIIGIRQVLNQDATLDEDDEEDKQLLDAFIEKYKTLIPEKYRTPRYYVTIDCEEFREGMWWSDESIEREFKDLKIT
jgi:hypothetical protein